MKETKPEDDTVNRSGDPAGTVRSNDGTEIAFDRLGSGPPVIIVGGSLTDRSAGAPLATSLSSSFTAYSYDRRGRGDSTDTAPYAVAREIEDLEALVEEAGGSASVFGMSSGAILALEATIRGLDVSKLALYEPPFGANDGRSRSPADVATQLEELVSAGRRGEAVERFLTTEVGMPEATVAQMRESPAWSTFEAVAPTLVYDVTVVGDGSVPAERLASVRAPTLVMDGGESPEWAGQAAQAVADALPEGRRRTLTGQTHDVAPDVLASAVEAFFAT